MISQPAGTIRSLIILAVVVTAAAGCSSNETVATVSKQSAAAVARPPATRKVGDKAAAIALQQVGSPYRYGGSSPGGFDCSGLAYYSYASAGKGIPRTTAGQWSGLQPVDDRNMQAGDLLFFSISGKMSHVGMYVGGGRFVHAPSTGKVVSVESLNSQYYRNAFIRAGRPR